MTDTLPEILTSRLRLRLESPEEVRRSIANMPPEMTAELSPAWLAKVQEATEPDPWLHGFAIQALEEPDKNVGSIGFKGPPEEGVVEVAYGIDESHQGKGYATEALQGIVPFAIAQPGVTAIRAHTLPETNASTSVLKKNGFTFVGDVIDPEDGEVWRWEFEAGES